MLVRLVPTASLLLTCPRRRPFASATIAPRQGKGHVSSNMERLTNCSLSYVPLIAPATSETRMKLLCKIADSFIYVVSRMGVTGATGTLSAGLPQLLERVHKYSGNVPAAVGFGVSTRDHFLSVGS